MPVAVLERDELGAADARDWFVTGEAAFREELAETVGAVGLVVARRESRARQTCLTVCADEALPVPRLVLVRDAAAGDHLVAFDTPRGEFFFVALGAVDLLFPGNEALRSYGGLADHAAETFFVPLSRLVFHFLSSCSEDFMATVTP